MFWLILYNIYRFPWKENGKEKKNNKSLLHFCVFSFLKSFKKNELLILQYPKNNAKNALEKTKHLKILIFVRCVHFLLFPELFKTIDLGFSDSCSMNFSLGCWHVFFQFYYILLFSRTVNFIYLDTIISFSQR